MDETLPPDTTAQLAETFAAVTKERAALVARQAETVARLAEIDAWIANTVAGSPVPQSVPTITHENLTSTRQPNIPPPQPHEEVKTARSGGIGSRGTGTPGRVLKFLEDHPDRPFRAPEIVAALEPSKEGEARTHFDMLVRTALSKFCQADPPLVQRVSHGLYQIIKNKDGAR